MTQGRKCEGQGRWMLARRQCLRTTSSWLGKHALRLEQSEPVTSCPQPRRRACMHCPMRSIASAPFPPPRPAGHYHAALCCFELAHCTVDATPGCHSMEVAEGLLQRGDEHYKLANWWLQVALWKERWWGMLCWAADRQEAGFALPAPACSPSRPPAAANHLTLPLPCHVLYSHRAHWAAGHKRECAKLAATQGQGK